MGAFTFGHQEVILLLLMINAPLVTLASAILGFYPGVSDLSSKYDSNLTIAFILPYNHFWNMTTHEEYEDCGDDCVFFREMDSAAEWMVNIINNSSEILPNTMVNILRVHEWDIGDASFGDVAPATLSLIEDASNPVVVYGTSSSTRGALAAGILSQFKIPLCAGSLNSPKLSNKANYPYFFRPTFGNTWGKSIATLYSRWGVKQVSMVFDSYDEESRLACLDIKAALFAAGVRFLAVLSYKGNRKGIDFSGITQELRKVDARYIVLCAQGWSESFSLILAANRTGLISKDHVWTVTNVPYPPYEADSSELTLLDGLVEPSLTWQPDTAPFYLSLQQQWSDLFDVDPVKYQNPEFNWASAGAYDCVGVLLTGLDKVMKEEGTTILSPRIRSKLGYNAFSNTGFKGLNTNPILLNDNGDISAETTFTTPSHDNYSPFAIIDMFGKYVPLKDPVFVGGATVPPWDGSKPPLPVLLATLSDPRGKAIAILVAISNSIAISAMCFVAVYKTHPSVRTINPSHACLSMVGSIALMGSMACYLNEPRQWKCYTRVWLMYLGIVLLTVPLVMKNWYILQIFSLASSTTVKHLSRIFNISHVVTGVVVAVQICLLVAYTLTSNLYPTTITIEEVFIVHECVDHNHYSSISSSQSHQKSNNIAEVGLAVVSVLFVIALGACAIAVRNINHKYNDSSLLLICFLTLAILVVLDSQLGVDEYVLVKRVVFFFLAATHVPVILVAPKILQVFYKLNLDDLGVANGVSSSGCGAGAGVGGKKVLRASNSDVSEIKTPKKYFKSLPAEILVRFKKKKK
ncbi:periplasmic binding protein-like I [Obelidium mucronatum]|nr:periplasmic binding protein-like I [Obelidium mucronatum]